MAGSSNEAGRLKVASSRQQEISGRARGLLLNAGELFEQAEEAGLEIESDFPALLSQLEEPFAIFVCGEFNSGKSSLLNALAGSAVARVGVTPTTSKVEPLNSFEIADLSFIDSPGTNSILEGHQLQTERFLQRSDVVLFVTSTERPLADSEVRFLSLVEKRWGRRIFVALNKIDLVSADELSQIREFVEDGLLRTLNRTVPIYYVSAKTGAGVSDLRSSLIAALGEDERFRLKLAGPLSSLTTYCKELRAALAVRQKHLKDELLVHERILERTKKRSEEGAVIGQLAGQQIRSLFMDVGHRIEGLIDEHFGFFTVLKGRIVGGEGAFKSSLQKILERSDLEPRLNKIVGETALAVKNFRDRLFREVVEDFALASAVSDRAYEFPVIDTPSIDISKVSEELRILAERGVNNSIALGSIAAATGVGAKIVTATAMIEISGLVMALVLAVLSFKALPRERQVAKRKVGENLRALSESFDKALKNAIGAQLAESVRALESELMPRIEKLRGDERHLLLLDARVLEIHKNEEALRAEL